MTNFRRCVLGVAVTIAGALTSGTDMLPKFSLINSASATESPLAAVDEGRMPDLDGAVGWLNSPPLNRKSLRGKVVLVDF
jgi:hypothetical protein